jgi:hypothetical protein
MCICIFRPVALKFRRNIIISDGTPWGNNSFHYLSPVLTRGPTAELPKPAGIGIIFKVGNDGGLVVKSMAEDGPAKESGQIQVDDCLMSVDRSKVFGQPITQVAPSLPLGLLAVETFRHSRSALPTSGSTQSQAASVRFQRCPLAAPLLPTTPSRPQCETRTLEEGAVGAHK